MSIPPEELEIILSDRFDADRKEKLALREQLESLEVKIKATRKQMGQNPRESEQDLDAAFQRLEHAHNTTSGTKGDERAFMHERDKIRQKKKALAKYMKLQGELDGMRAQMTETRRALAEKEESISELHSGLRKIRLANKLSVESHDIIEQRYVIDDSKVPRIVGRGGGNLRSIEADCGVSCEVDNSGGGIRIMGTAATIAAAYTAISAIAATSVDEFSLADETVVCLLMDKAQRVNDIQARYSVRVDVSRAKSLCKLTGLTASVQAAKEEILGMQSTRTDILIDAAYLAFIIGKGGANITAMEQQHNVAINLNRERNTIEITGMKPAVSSAVQQLKDLIDENKDVEESIKLERHVLLGCLVGVGSGGQGGIRGLNKEFGVRIDTEGNKEDTLLTLTIRGPTAKVAAAKARVLELVQTFISNSVQMQLDEELIPVLLGRGGSGIKALREKHSGALIDIEDGVVHIQSASEEARAAARAEVEALVAANQSLTLTLSEDCIIQLKSQRGTEVRDKLQKELGLRLNIDKGNAFVKLRGAEPQLTAGATLLEDFRRSRAASRVVVQDEDYPMFLKAGEDSVVKAFEAKFGVEISSNRKDLTFTIRGAPAQVADAEEAITGFLAGDEALRRGAGGFGSAGAVRADRQGRRQRAPRWSKSSGA